ncbi:MAG: dihydroorotase [Kofleriaceae bacterium]|nr:dihydroorotase [Kofleriaceae bacterium]MBP6838375.1 dihydroorotase [Kofleriaceae bacterium]MBP9202817.1 dihydroorotase [Kofleriaceae bacterium]
MTRTTIHFDLIVRGGTVVTAGGAEVTDVGIRGGRIAALGDLGGVRAMHQLDAAGLHVLPGVIDGQVHFREPGLTHKEDLATGTTAAVLGGVTCVLEMPNTTPATASATELADKVGRLRGRARCDVGFFLGATSGNSEDLGQLESLPGCAGVKVFMGSSTGSLLVSDDETLATVLSNGHRRVAVHAEDQSRLEARRPLTAGGVVAHADWRDAETAFGATWRLLALARRFGRRVHLLHVSTAEEMSMLEGCRDIATCEVSPQHLTLSAPECYERLGTRAQMNPPIRSVHHREALWEAVRTGVVDLIATDHAPHTLDEKAAPYPSSPSGMPGVQTLLPVMLDHVAAGRLSLARLVDLLCDGPARVWGVAGKGRIACGYDADLVLVDLAARHTLRDADMASRCGWTPFDGMEVTGKPVATIVHGQLAMRDGQLVGEPTGRAARFVETLAPQASLR